MLLGDYRRATGLTLAILVAGCGGGGGGSSGAGDQPVAAAANYFPVDAGNRWIYASTTPASGPTIVSNTGTQQVAGQTGTVFTTIDGMDGSTSADIYVVTSTGVKDYAPADADAISKALSGIQVINYPIQIGASYPQVDTTVDSGIDFDGDGRSDKVRVRATLSVVGIETVATSIATVSSALHQREAIIETVIPSSGAASVDVNITIDSWYGDGIGLLKSTTVSSAAGVGTSTTTQSLTGYRVGSFKTDVTAPVVQSIAPSATVVRGINTSVSATFSEPVDAATVNAATFTVTDAANAPVAGALQVSGNTVTFIAAQPWVSGTFTANLTSGVQDLLGNGLAADRRWTFTVDATGPGIVNVTPAAGAQDVGLAAPIVITFSEVADPASVTATTVRLTGNDTEVAATRTVSGATVALSPTTPLSRATQYTLSIVGVTDLVGNSMAAPYIGMFQTSQGRFSYPVTVAPLALGSISVMAVGDVNGDGIPDVLFATIGSDGGLYVAAGKADGSLAAPIRVNIGPQLHCFITGIAIGDVNSDGRPDVAVAGNYCGVQILHQAPDGTLVVGEFLSGVTADKIRIADLDHSGKNALLGVGGGTSAVSIWRQDGSGALALSQTLSLGVDFGQALEIGDVNGDGLPDIVVGFPGSLGRDVGVLLQQPGGSFAAPYFLSVASIVGGVRGLAIGDLNGDGRQDLVITASGNSPTSIYVFYQGANGSLGQPVLINSYDIPGSVRIVDIDGDGRSDVVVFHEGWNAFGVYLQQPGGALGAEVLYTAPYGGTGADAMAVGDVNLDGKPDIVVGGTIILQRSALLQSMTLSAQSKRAAQRGMTRSLTLGIPSR